MVIFGTDGIRGIANKDLTADLAKTLGFITAKHISKENGTIVIGRDTRDSGKWLEEALIEGFIKHRVEVKSCGVLPTPAISFLTKELNAQMGVVVSASHNPNQYNGIKFFDHNGIKLSEELEQKIEEEYKRTKNIPSNSSKGTAAKIDGAGLYVDHLKDVIQEDLTGLTVSLDCANGAASFVGPRLFEELGIITGFVSCSPNGMNINLECGSTNPGKLQKQMKQQDIDVGIALDGDADRMVAVDEKGNIVDGDYIMAICAKHLKESDPAKEIKVVTTVMTNLGFHLAMKELGVGVLSTQVGDKYVLDEMIKSNIMLGGEQSGHIIFLEHSPAGDGLQTALKLLEIIKKTGQPLSRLAGVMQRLPQVLLNINVYNKNGLNENETVISAIKRAEEELGNKGRILVRSSGTEELIRVMTESDSLEHAKSVAGKVAAVIEKEFN